MNANDHLRDLFIRAINELGMGHGDIEEKFSCFVARVSESYHGHWDTTIVFEVRVDTRQDPRYFKVEVTPSGPTSQRAAPVDRVVKMVEEISFEEVR